MINESLKGIDISFIKINYTSYLLAYSQLVFETNLDKNKMQCCLQFILIKYVDQLYTYFQYYGFHLKHFIII